MAITKQNPQKVLLAGRSVCIEENEHFAGVEITPGMIVEFYADTTLKVKPHASADEIVTLAVALEQGELNQGLSDVYAIDDLVKVAFLPPGAVFYGLIPSGQDIAYGEFLQSNGDGKLKTATGTTQSAPLGKFQSLDAPGAVTADTRLRVQVVN